MNNVYLEEEVTTAVLDDLEDMLEDCDSLEELLDYLDGLGDGDGDSEYDEDEDSYFTEDQIEKLSWNSDKWYEMSYRKYVECSLDCVCEEEEIDDWSEQDDEEEFIEEYFN